MMETIDRNELAPQDSPRDGWQIIEAHGEWPHEYEGGRTLRTVIDNEAVAAIVAAGVPDEGLLCDRDHLSHDMSQSTEAAAWVRKLAACPSATEPGQYDLAGWLEYTSAGRGLVEGKVYKHFSTEYLLTAGNAELLGEGRYRPLRLAGLALTNRPNNGGQRPIVNRTPSNVNPNTTTNNMTPEQVQELALLLGLDANASFEDIKAAIGKMFDTVQNAEEETAKELIENADTDGELDEDEKDMYTKELVANRAKGMALLNKRLGRKPAVHNRVGVVINAGRPRSVLGGKSDPRRLYNRAKSLQMAGEHGGDWVKCYNQARTESK